MTIERAQVSSLMVRHAGQRTHRNRSRRVMAAPIVGEKIIGICLAWRSFQAAIRRSLAYHSFCRLDLDDQVPDHSTFSVNRHGRFRDSDILRHVFEAVVRACMDAGLIKGEGFAVDASVIRGSRQPLSRQGTR